MRNPALPGHRRRTLRRLSIGWAIVLLATLAPAVAGATTFTATGPCGAYYVERYDSTFTGTFCDGHVTVDGTYAGNELTVTRIAAGSLSVDTDQRFTSSGGEDWRPVLDEIAQAAAAFRSWGQALADSGTSPADLVELASQYSPVGAGAACEPQDYILGLGVGIHIFRGPVLGDVTVQLTCIAISYSDMDLDNLTVNGWLFSAGDISATSATLADTAGLGGVAETGGSFVAPTLQLAGGSLSAGENVSTRTLTATDSDIAAGAALRARPLGPGDGAVNLQGSELSAAELDTPRLEARASRISGGRTTIETILLDGSVLQAGDLTTSSLHGSSSQVSAGTLTARTGPGLVQITGGPGALIGAPAGGGAGLRAAHVDATTVHVEQTSVVAPRITADTLRSLRADISATGDLTPARIRIAAGSLAAESTAVHGDPIEIRADTLRMTGGRIESPAGQGESIQVDVSGATEMTGTRVAARNIRAALGDATVGPGTAFNADFGGDAPRDATIWDGSNDTRRRTTGASHGGFGGTAGHLNINWFEPADAPAGSPHEPLPRGPGGWGFDYYEHTKGGVGGGAIAISAGNLAWNAQATAGGGNATIPLGPGGGGGAGGGAGGSIWVKASGTLSGNGRFAANGGNGSFAYGGELVDYSGGGGSGGRIRIDYGTLGDWRGQAQAVGGRGGQYDAGAAREWARVPMWDHALNHGGPGTVYWKPAGGPGTIVIDGSGGPGGVGGLSGSFPDDNVEIRSALVVTKGLTARSLVLKGGAVLAPDDPRVRLPFPPPARHSVPAGMPEAQVGSQQQLYPGWVWEDPPEERVEIRVSGDATVDSASRLDLTARGGYGRMDYDFSRGLYPNRAGGSHGGQGGAGRAGNPNQLGRPSAASGSDAEPITVGEGGWGNHSFEPRHHAVCGLGGSGGGALRLSVGGVLQVGGKVLADGGPGAADDDCTEPQGTGGGAGGSIWITARALTGSGTVSASGGAGSFDEFHTMWGGGGGGGRVAVYADLSQFRGRLLADGGAGGAGAGVIADQFRGQPGSVVRGTAPGAGGSGTGGGGGGTPSGGTSGGGTSSGGTTGGTAGLPLVTVRLNGTELRTDVPAHIRDGRTMIPFRALLEALGATVGYDPATKTVTATRAGTTVQLVIGSRQARVNGQVYTLDVAPYAMDGRTFVPVRFVSEQLGFRVTYDAATRTVQIFGQ